MGLWQRTVERTVVPWGRDRLGGAPEALSARANRHLLGLPRVLPRKQAGVGSGEGRCGVERWRGELRCGYLPVAPIRAGLGALARPASPPTRLPSRPAPAARSFGCWAGSGAEPQHPEKFAIFVIFCFRKNVKDFPQKFGRRPRIAPIILVAAGWVCPSSCLPPKLIKFRPRGITAATGWLPAARTEIKIPVDPFLPSDRRRSSAAAPLLLRLAFMALTGVI